MAAVESLIAERKQNGPFADLTEFCRRIDVDKLNRRALEAMIKSGAMDEFGESRRSLMHRVPEAMAGADQAARAAAAGQNDMFGLDVPAPEPESAPAKPVTTSCCMTQVPTTSRTRSSITACHPAPYSAPIGRRA